MPETKILTLEHKGHSYVLPDADADQYQPESVKEWTLQHREFTLDDLREVGLKMNASGLINDAGVGDATAIAGTRGRFVAERVLTSPALSELPIPVVSEFGRRLFYGPSISQSELESLKKR